MKWEDFDEETRNAVLEKRRKEEERQTELRQHRIRRIRFTAVSGSVAALLVSVMMEGGSSAFILLFTLLGGAGGLAFSAYRLSHLSAAALYGGTGIVLAGFAFSSGWIKPNVFSFWFLLLLYVCFGAFLSFYAAGHRDRTENPF